MSSRRPQVLAGVGLLGLVPTLFLEWMAVEAGAPARVDPQSGWEAVGPIAVLPLGATLVLTLVWLLRSHHGTPVTPTLVYLVAAGGLHQTLSIGAHLLLPDGGLTVRWPALLSLGLAALVAAGGLVAARAAAREHRTLAQDVGLDG